MQYIHFLCILAAFAGFDLIWWRSADRRLRGTRGAKITRAALAAFVALMLLYLVLSGAWTNSLRRSRGPVPIWFHTIVYLWHFLVLPSTLGLLALGKLWPWIPGRKSKAVVVPTGMSDRIVSERNPIPNAGASMGGRLSRRQILAVATIAAPPLITAAATLGSVTSLYGRRIRRFDLTIPQLPPQLRGMTIAHVSDTHIGKFFHPDRLPDVAEAVNKLDADFVVFTGDLIDLALDDLPDGIRFLQSLKPRCGLVVCEGNHDLMQDRGEFEWQVRNAGLPLIISGERMLPFVSRSGQHYPVQFLGVPWNNPDEFMASAVQAVVPTVRPDSFPILLAHHPHNFDPAVEGGLPLVLSGHTHGGQIMLTEQFGAGNLRFRYLSGHYRKGNSQLIVNNGLGNWFPLRINAPAEIVQITLA